MKSNYKILILVINILAIPCIVNTQNNQPNINIDLKIIKRTLEAEINKMLIETGIPSISIALVKNDSIIFSDAYGFANVKKRIPASTQTIYNTGSNFKFVTATAIMKLAESGKIKIDDPINNYLDIPIKDMLNEGYPVTFRHLLSHHSGLTGPIEMVRLWDRELPSSLNDLPAKITVRGKPGEKFRYGNHNYALLGLAIENITGILFQDYVFSEILKPLSVKENPMNPSPRMIEELALPYTIINNRSVPEYQVRLNVYPAGDMYLTVNDMAKFLIMQLNDGVFNGNLILHKDLISEMQRSQFDSNYGLGTGVLARKEGKVLNHTGGLPGFSSYFKVWTESKIGIYVASNSGEAYEVLDAVTTLAWNLINGKDIEPLKSYAKSVFDEISLPIDRLKMYPGIYQLGPGVEFTITLEGDQLYSQVTGQKKNKIFAYEEDKFFYKVANAQIIFNVENSIANSITIIQNGKHTANRIK